MAALDSVAADQWLRQLDGFTGMIGGRFVRVETRRTAGPMLIGMMSELPTKNKNRPAASRRTNSRRGDHSIGQPELIT
ncbi:hypothetical protein [Nocardia gipuzkoensis]